MWSPCTWVGTASQGHLSGWSASAASARQLQCTLCPSVANFLRVKHKYLNTLLDCADFQSLLRMFPVLANQYSDAWTKNKALRTHRPEFKSELEMGRRLDNTCQDVHILVLTLRGKRM